MPNLSPQVMASRVVLDKAKSTDTGARMPGYVVSGLYLIVTWVLTILRTLMVG